MGADIRESWESSLDSVVVYASGALCRRRARGAVPADGRVWLGGLPRALDHGSLRARVVDGEGQVVEARVEVAAELRGEEQLSELQRAYRRAEEAADAARERVARQRSRIAEVAALRAVTPQRRRDEPHRRTPADALLELAGFVDARLTGLQARAAELEQQLREAEHAVEIAQDRLIRASSAEAADAVETSVTAVVTLHGGGEVELELEYGVPGARWVPTYRLSHRQDEGTARLVLRASVAQRTGEDWTGVRLGLSTADLERGADLPKLRSLRIGRSQPAPAPAGWREPPAGLNDLFAGYDASGPRPRPAGPAVAGFGGRMAGAAPVGAAIAVAGPGGAPGYGAQEPVAEEAGDFQRLAKAAPRSRSAAFAPAPVLSAPSPAPQASAAPQAPAAPGGAPLAAPPPPPVGPPHPSAAQLDYAALALSGPEEPAARRGRLLPAQPADPTAGEYRRRAESVAALPLPGHAVRPRESAGSFDHRYDAVAPADIPSDGGWHTVTVAEVPTGVRTEYLTVPSVEPAVYTTLLLTNPTDRPFLAGPVEVTVDGDFLLTAALPTLAPGATRRVGLGQAEGIRVARRTELRESTARMLNNTTVLDHRIHLDLANRLAHPATVEIRERVPVTSDPDIRIEERADWQSPDVPSDEFPPSTRIWRVQLPPGGTAELHGGYEIRIPAGKALVGGNRRS